MDVYACFHNAHYIITHMYIWTHTHTHTHTHACMHAYMNVWTYIYACTCTHTHFLRKHLLMALMKEDFPMFGVPNIIILIPCNKNRHMWSLITTLTVFGTTPPAKSTIHGNICKMYATPLSHSSVFKITWSCQNVIIYRSWFPIYHAYFIFTNCKVIYQGQTDIYPQNTLTHEQTSLIQSSWCDLLLTANT